MMTTELTPILIPIAFFASIVIIINIIFKTIIKERLALIEKGIDLSVLNKDKKQISILGSGMVSAGFGSGLFVGYLLQEFTNVPPAAAYFSMIFLFLGFGLVAYYFVDKKNKR